MGMHVYHPSTREVTEWRSLIAHHPGLCSEDPSSHKNMHCQGDNSGHWNDHSVMLCSVQCISTTLYFTTVQESIRLWYLYSCVPLSGSVLSTENLMMREWGWQTTIVQIIKTDVCQVGKAAWEKGRHGRGKSCHLKHSKHKAAEQLSEKDERL